MITCKSIHTGGLGRFGNQCFSISSTIGIAIKNGQPFGFPIWINKDNEIFGDHPDRMNDYFVNPLPPMFEGIDYIDIPYHWEYRDYNIPTGNWNICSHLQDERYFSHCIDTIRHYFRMKDEPEQNDFVAIHYRAGDYIPDPAAYHPRCAMDYYERAMRHFEDETKFLVFSDDIEAAHKLLWNGDDARSLTFVGANAARKGNKTNYLEDFALMKKCKSFITANSSFSLFASILGEHPDKRIISPRRWFGDAAGGMQFEGYPLNAIVL